MDKECGHGLKSLVLACLQEALRELGVEKPGSHLVADRLQEIEVLQGEGCRPDAVTQQYHRQNFATRHDGDADSRSAFEKLVGMASPQGGRPIVLAALDI